MSFLPIYSQKCIKTIKKAFFNYSQEIYLLLISILNKDDYDKNSYQLVGDLCVDKCAETP